MKGVEGRKEINLACVRVCGTCSTVTRCLRRSPLREMFDKIKGIADFFRSNFFSMGAKSLI
jgi:hypothetical protein